MPTKNSRPITLAFWPDRDVVVPKPPPEPQPEVLSAPLATPDQRQAALAALDTLRELFQVSMNKLARSLNLQFTYDLKTTIVRRRKLLLSFLQALADTLEMSLEEFLNLKAIQLESPQAQQLKARLADLKLFDLRAVATSEKLTAVKST
jgi:hypothetical protein